MINKFYSFFDFKVAHINPMLGSRVSGVEYLNRYLIENNLPDDTGIESLNQKIYYYLKLVDDYISKDVECIENLVKYYRDLDSHKFEKNKNDKLGWSFDHTYIDLNVVDENERARLRYWEIMNNKKSTEAYCFSIRDLILSYFLSDDKSSLGDGESSIQLINIIFKKFNTLGGTNPFVNRIPKHKITGKNPYGYETNKDGYPIMVCGRSGYCINAHKCGTCYYCPETGGSETDF